MNEKSVLRASTIVYYFREVKNNKDFPEVVYDVLGNTVVIPPKGSAQVLSMKIVPAKIKEKEKARDDPNDE